MDHPKSFSWCFSWEVGALLGLGVTALHFTCRKSSIIVAADESTISWGPSPTFGELVRNDQHPATQHPDLPIPSPRSFGAGALGVVHPPHSQLFRGPACVLQGYGDHKPKSSTAAQEVKTLDGIYTEQVSGDPNTCTLGCFQPMGGCHP